MSDPFKNKNGKYEHDGEEYETATELIQGGFLGFCQCGMPEENILYVLKGLELIDETSPDDLLGKPGYREAHDEWWKKHEARVIAHFGNLASAYFFYYWADAEGLTEHGGSVPGWLTDETKQFVTDLQAWKELESK